MSRANRLLAMLFATALAAIAGTPPAVAAPARPAPPCDLSALPPAIASRVAELGGIRRFGCFDVERDGAYLFRYGRIEAIPAYGANATYALVTNPADPLRIMHLYVSGADYAYSTWIVRLSDDGVSINQVTYEAGDTDDISGTYANDILVHPGVGRHGTFEVGIEGCETYAGAPSSCRGFGSAVFRLHL